MQYLLLKPNRYAILDLGTNTFELMIAQVEDLGMKTVYRETVSVKIGKEGISEGIINEEAQKRIFQAFTRFSQTIQAYQVPADRVLAIATSAFRNAKNGYQIATYIYQNFGIKIEIIKGNQEAEYIYSGARQAVDIGEKTSLIVDIGGGSVEFILANEKKIFWKQSFEIGAQRLMDKFMKNDPIKQLDLQRLLLYLEVELRDLSAQVFSHTPQLLIGCAGAFNTLANMAHLLETQNEPILDEQGDMIPRNYVVELDYFYHLYQNIVSKNMHERSLLAGMSPIRIDSMVVTVTLIKFIVEKIEAECIYASSYALKEGVFFSRILAK